MEFKVNVYFSLPSGEFGERNTSNNKQRGKYIIQPLQGSGLFKHVQLAFIVVQIIKVFKNCIHPKINTARITANITNNETKTRHPGIVLSIDTNNITDIDEKDNTIENAWNIITYFLAKLVSVVEPSNALGIIGDLNLNDIIKKDDIETIEKLLLDIFTEKYSYKISNEITVNIEKVNKELKVSGQVGINQSKGQTSKFLRAIYIGHILSAVLMSKKKSFKLKIAHDNNDLPHKETITIHYDEIQTVEITGLINELAIKNSSAETYKKHIYKITTTVEYNKQIGQIQFKFNKGEIIEDDTPHETDKKLDKRQQDFISDQNKE